MSIPGGLSKISSWKLEPRSDLLQLRAARRVFDDEAHGFEGVADLVGTFEVLRFPHRGALFQEGEALSDIAEKLKLTTLEVKLTVDSLRSHGVLPTEEVAETPISQAPSAEPDEEDEAESVEDNSSERPATKEQLLAEVAKQQQGTKSRVVVLQTTEVRKHSHKIKVDRLGNGQSIPDSSGHAHRCFRFVLSEAHKHTHDLVVLG